jgi:hypothetical protein
MILVLSTGVELLSEVAELSESEEEEVELVGTCVQGLVNQRTVRAAR